MADPVRYMDLPLLRRIDESLAAPHLPEAQLSGDNIAFVYIEYTLGSLRPNNYL